MAEKIVAIIQARLGSSRLPMKSMLTLRDAPLIDWVTGRVSWAKCLAATVAAIPDTPLDEVLASHLRGAGVEWVVGPENDVLGRFLLAARAARADLIVRVCADNPLIWWEAIDMLVDFYKSGSYDYAYNHIPRGNLWPDGLGAEIVSRQLLEDIGQKASLPAQREHCFNYIWDNAEKFRIGTFNPPEKWLCRPDIRLDIDTAEDFRRLALLPFSRRMNAREIVETWDRAQA